MMMEPGSPTETYDANTKKKVDAGVISKLILNRTSILVAENRT
jgi:hypothetical protein